MSEQLKEKQIDVDVITLKKGDFRHKQFFYIFLSISISTFTVPMLIFIGDGFTVSSGIILITAVLMGDFASFYVYHLMKNARLYLSNEKIHSPMGYIPILHPKSPIYSIPKCTIPLASIKNVSLSRSTYFKRLKRPEFIQLTLTTSQGNYTFYPTEWYSKSAALKAKQISTFKQYSQQELEQQVLQSPLIQYLIQQDIAINMENDLFKVD